MFKELAHKHWGGVSVVFTRSPVQPVKTVAQVYFGHGGVLVFNLGGCHRAGRGKRCSTHECNVFVFIV